MQSMSPNKSRGFTLVEVLVIAPIVILSVGAFVGVMVNLTGEVLKTQQQNTAVQQTQDALDTIERDIKLSGAYLAGNELVAPSPQSYTNGAAGVNHFTNVTTDSTKPIKNMLILRTFTTDKNPLDSGRKPVYTNQPSGSCDANRKTTNKLQPYNVIYFVKDGSLWRRTLLQTGRGTPELCDTIWQKPSCAPIATKNTACLVNDMKLVDNVTKFDMEYFPDATSTTPNTTATSTSATVAARNDTLANMDTVRVSIETTSPVANDDVKHLAALRATRLNIASEPPLNIYLNITSQPSNQTVLVSESATFRVVTNLKNVNIKWQRWMPLDPVFRDIAGATGDTYIITNADRAWNGYRYRAIVTDSYDTKTSSEATLTVNRWGSINLEGGWTNYGGGYHSEGYTRTTAGLVMLKGLIRNTSAVGTGQTIGTLPPGYRPTGRLIFVASNYPNTEAARVDILADGSIVYINGNLDWISLENIRFMPASGNYSFTPLTPQNFWVNHLDTYATAGYVRDSIGRITTQGLVKSGTVANGTVIIAPPLDSRPDEYMHYPSRGPGYEFLGLSPDGVLSKGGSNSYKSLNTTYYPNTFTGWSILNLQSGWTWYDAGGGQFTKPRYTKSADNVVTLRGLVRSGSTAADTVIATLPAGYRPAGRTLTINASNGGIGRVDIMSTTGEVRFMAGSNAWFSLDAISFIAE